MIRIRVYNPDYYPTDRDPTLWDKVKAFAFGIFGLFFAVLWVFGGFIGALVAALNGHLVSLVLSIFLPVYGFIYTLIMIIAAIF